MRGRAGHPNAPWLPIALLLLFLILYAALQLYSLGPFEGDENIYFYLAHRAASGALPYRDFFHAHPPFHLLPGVIVFRLIGGFDETAGRIIPMLAAAATGVLLYRAASTRGAATGLLASFFYLFSFHVLLISGHFLGASLCAMWVALALERAARSHFGASGIAFACATFTLLNAAPAGVGVGIALLWLDRKGARRYALAGLCAFAALNAVAALVFGQALFDQVYLYHLGKAARTGYSPAVFRSVAYADPWLAYGALAGVATLLLQRDADADIDEEAHRKTSVDRDEGGLLLPISLGGALASVVFLVTVPRLFAHYFLVMFCCLAPLAAAGWVEIARRALDAWVLRRGRVAGEAALLLVIACAGLLPFGFDRTHDSLPNGEYTFRPAGTAIVDVPVRLLFWRDEKLAQTRYAGVTRFLWSSTRRFDSAAELVDVVQHSSGEQETIFGDSTSTPLVALLAGRRITRDEADTNAMRFQREDGDVARLVERLDADPPRLVIGRWGFEILSFDETKRWLRQRFERIHTVLEPSVADTYEVWRLRDPEPASVP